MHSNTSGSIPNKNIYDRSSKVLFILKYCIHWKWLFLTKLMVKLTILVIKSVDYFVMYIEQ